MTLRNATRMLALGLVLATVFAKGASAEVRFFGETASKYFFCDAEASHPRKVEVQQIVQEDYRNLASVMFLGEYEIQRNEDAGEGKTSAKVKTTIHLLRDGKWRKVGKLSGNVYNDFEEAYSEAIKSFPVSLGPGDILRWRFTFKNLPAMAKGEQFHAMGGVIYEFPGD